MKAANDQPRILVFDIETKMFEVLTFGIREQFIDYKQIKDIEASGRLIHCIGMKWAGQRKTTVLSEWEHGYEGMIRAFFDAVNEADAIVTFNGDKFDWPKMIGQFALYGLGLPRPVPQIDIYKTTRKMGFPCGKLDYLSQLFGIGKKVKHPGQDMWRGCLFGDPASQAKMARYCGGDVRLTEEMYFRVRPYMATHPRIGNRHGMTCPNCGSNNLTSQGWKPTRTVRVQSLKCGDCGSWTQGKREKIAA